MSDYETMKWEYWYYFIGAIEGYLAGDLTVAKYKADVRRLIKDYFPKAFNSGWVDGGGDVTSIADNDTAWLDARISAEIGYIDTLFESAKQLRDSGETDRYQEFANQKADGYARTLDGIYNEGKIRGGKDIALTFVGDDGEESCKTCQKWKGKRHRKSFWENRGLIPGQPGNPNFECRGYNCQHFLVDDNGNRYTF